MRVALDVVGAGYGRTGTLSLKHALERLGFDGCYHMIEVMRHPAHRAMWAAAQRGEAVDWDTLFDGYRAAVDWPACNFWQPLSEHYPESKVILSTRDPERWYESVRSTIYPSSMSRLSSEDATERSHGAWVSEIIWDGVFGGRLEDRDYAIAIYERHVETVRNSVPADRLLVFEAADGWEPLCAFLDRPVPDEPYPRVNTTKEFRTRFKVPGRGTAHGR